MNKNFIVTALFACLSLLAISQPIAYDAHSISPALKEGAHVIKRYENIVFEVTDVDRAKQSVHVVYTVLDKEGSKTLFFNEYTDKHRSLEDVEINVYDINGKQINRFKRKDLMKQAISDGISLVLDGMYNYLDINTSSYPVTVEYSYKQVQTGTLTYPPYTIQNSEEAVEYSSYTAKVPADLDLRFKEQKISLKPTISHELKLKVYKWEIKNLPAYKREEGSVGYIFNNSSILLAPNKFRHFNTHGEMSSWKAFGEWGYNLLKGLDELPAERKQFFNELVKNAPSEREKVALIYKYMQQNFRYVSIQLGIGGVKPFAAQFTDEKKYGDCKGLSFYMHAALKVVGIKSYVAFINASYNQEPVDADFPCDRFNHAILCVPQAKDSIWLECTSNTADFAVLGSFTENRNALLLTEKGGVLVPTPKGKSSNNTMFSTTQITLFDDGSGNTSTALSSKGYFREIMNDMLIAKKDDQKKFLVKTLGFKQPDEFTVVKSSQAEECHVNIGLSIEKIPQFSAGNKMFLNPRVYNIWSKVLPKSEGRKQDYYFSDVFIRTDTTIYTIPAEYIAETLPKPAKFSCDYASYTTEYTYDKEKNQLMNIARLELRENRISAAKYAEVKQFFDGVIAEETQKIVIRKN